MLTGTITHLRGLALLQLTDVCQIGAGTVSDDGGGGGTVLWAYGSDVPCRIDDLSSARELAVAERVSDRSTHTVTVPPLTSITPANRLRITSGGTYEVLAVGSQTNERYRFVEVVEVT